MSLSSRDPAIRSCSLGETGHRNRPPRAVQFGRDTAFRELGDPRDAENLDTVRGG